MTKIKINEIFWTAQGEGARKGFPSIFVRVTGCSVRCEYCDSKSSWDEGELLSEDEIVIKIDELMKKYPGSQVVFTGGEPLEQNIEGVAEKLKNKNYFLAVETSGIFNSDIDFNWWAVSPKDACDFKITEEIRKKISELKLIVNSNLNVDIVRQVSEGLDNVPVYLQPKFPDPDRYERTFKLFQSCVMEGLVNIMIGDQLHRHYNIR